MPELPEVETIVLALKKMLVGQKILNIEVRLSKLFHGRASELLNQKITDISRRGKIIIWQLGDCYLIIHLKMTGQLIFVPSSLGSRPVIGGHPDKLYALPLPHQYTHIIVQFATGTLYFNDLRQFGWWKLLPNDAALKKEIDHFGPEYDWPEFSLSYFREKLATRGKSRIKSLLLDQSIVAGIGNIYADESIFCAGVLPTRQAGSLSEGEINRLYHCLPKIFRLALDHGGTSSRDYRQIDGSQGTFLKVANVYRRTGLPCRVCGQLIRVAKVAGRSSHFCPNCQK